MNIFNLHKKSPASALILGAIIFFGIAAVAVAVVGIALYTELTGNNSGGPQTAGGLCGSVPAPYNDIFAKAGDKWKVQPAFLAALFLAGEHHAKGPVFNKNTSWPPSNGPWSSSRAGAQGPFQFMPGTWDGHKQDGNNDGLMEIQNLWDSAFAAAHLSAANGAGGNTTDISKLKDAAGKYNGGNNWEGKTESTDYASRVTQAFQYFYCAQGSATGKWVWPVEGRITSRFGETGPSHAQPHSGLDIAAPRDTPIKAVDGGTVVVVNADSSDITGIYVKIDHGNGLQSIYGHMIEGSPTVKVGDKVGQGQIIGKVDSTGHSTGNHLHLGVRKNGVFVNPLDYLPPK